MLKFVVKTIYYYIAIATCFLGHIANYYLSVMMSLMMARGNRATGKKWNTLQCL